MSRKSFLVALAFVLLLWGLFSGWVVSTAQGDLAWGRLLLGGGFFFVVTLGLLNSYFNRPRKEDPWYELAARTGLTCRARSGLLGYPLHLTGTYQGYPLTLYVQRRGRLQPAATRIELTVPNRAKTSLRLRGPYDADDAPFDRLIGNFFGARKFEIGERLFFISSQPEQLAGNLFSPTDPRRKPLRDRLKTLTQPVNIEVQGSQLYFEQPGMILKNIAYIEFLFNLLSDLALEVERASSWTRI
ncbi:MAG: hypothetical protein ACE5H9_09650 [Anaerolineae bacterium]